MVSDIHRNTLRAQEVADDQRRLVSDTCNLFRSQMIK